MAEFCEVCGIEIGDNPQIDNRCIDCVGTDLEEITVASMSIVKEVTKEQQEEERVELAKDAQEWLEEVADEQKERIEK